MANPLTKKAGGQPVWAWGAELVGAFLVFRWYRARQAAAAANAASGITSGPPAVGGSGLTSGSSVAPPANLQAWVQDLLSAGPTGGASTGQLYNDIQAFLSGGCVSQSGYNAISNGIATLGIPPGYIGSLPALSVCASNPVSGTSGGGTTGAGGGTGGPSYSTGPTASQALGLTGAAGSNSASVYGVQSGNLPGTYNPGEVTGGQYTAPTNYLFGGNGAVNYTAGTGQGLTLNEIASAFNIPVSSILASNPGLAGTDPNANITGRQLTLVNPAAG